MPKLRALSISAKLYAAVALMTAVTLILATVAVVNASRHATLTDEFESAFVGSRKVEEINSLIYAVVMESRGIYMSPDIPTAKKYATGLDRFNEQIGTVVETWQQSVLPQDAEIFAEFAARVKKFQEFRRELVRRGTEISPAAGREWGDNDASRTVRTALTNDLDTLGKLYAARSRDIYAQIAYSLKASDVETVVIAGRVVMRNRKLLTIDEPRVLEKARAYQKSISASLGMP